MNERIFFSDIEELLLKTFSGYDLARARELLPEQPPSVQRTGAYRQLLLDIIELSRGSLSRLDYFSQRATRYPTDIFLIARVPAKLQPSEKELKKFLKGGPVTAPDEGSQDVYREKTMWDWNGFGSLQLCVVCRELVAREWWKNPTVRISRRLPSGNLQSQEVAVHKKCMKRGEEMAGEQALLWEPNVNEEGD